MWGVIHTGEALGDLYPLREVLQECMLTAELLGSTGKAAGGPLYGCSGLSADLVSLGWYLCAYYREKKAGVARDGGK